MPKITPQGPTALRHEVEVDTKIAAAHRAGLTATASEKLSLRQLHYLIPRHLRADRYKVDGHMSLDGKLFWPDPAKLEELFEAGVIGSLSGTHARNSEMKLFADYHAKRNAANKAWETYTEVAKEYDGWTRFFRVIGGHIHSSMECSTCNKAGHTTDFQWLPDLSGLTEANAVAIHGPWLCTVCYPTAPVEFTNGAELDAAAKAAKRCPASGNYVASGGRQALKCPACGKRVRVSSNSSLFTHDVPN
jgi:rubrerythrin